MSKKINFHLVKFFSILACFVLFFSSCSDEKRVHSNYIPDEVFAVISVNTERIFNDAVFDLMMEKDLGLDLKFLPLARVIQNPSSAGIKIFSKYHIFLSGTNLSKVKSGVIMPLSDSEDLAEYIKDKLKSKIVESEGFMAARISDDYNIIWDEYTAICYSSKLEEGIINEGKKFFNQTSNESLVIKDSTFTFALNSDSHISTWIKNDDFSKLISQGLFHLDQSGIYNALLSYSSILGDGKTIFLTNFNDGNISIKQLNYFKNNKNLSQYDLERENNVASLIPMAISEDPLVLISASVKSDILVQILEILGKAKSWSKQADDFSFLPQINQLSSYLGGDILALFDGFEEVKKIKNVPDLDDEGNDVLISREITEKKPIITIGMTVKDSVKFNFMMNMLSSKLPKLDGFFNYNNEAYFTVKGNYFFLTSTKKGIEVLNKMSGKLSSNLSSVVSDNKSVYFLNVYELLKKDNHFFEFLIPAITDLKDITAIRNRVTNRGVAEGNIKVTFMNQQNSFVSILKLFTELVSAFNLSNSVTIQ